MDASVFISKHDVHGPYAVLECSRFLPLLYSGKGALLCVHGADGTLLCVCQAFDAQNIHGVREVCHCAGDVVELLAFSDKYIRHLALQYRATDGLVSVRVVNRFKLFDDFIWDCALVNDKRQLVVGFAHNRVQVYTVREAGGEAEDGGLVLVGDVRCTPQCVLYCMNICTANAGEALGGANGRMLIASGTCFHDVTLWHTDDWGAEPEVKCTLRGHKGVVFRMAFCETTMTLLTVSDDRTARLWSVEDGRELAVFWGHTDRVWDAIFCGEYVVTSSEDSTVKIWKRDGTCLATLWGHSDDSWRLAHRQLLDGSHIVYSAGADGSIKAWPLEYHLQNSAQETRMASVPLPVLERPPPPTQQPESVVVDDDKDDDDKDDHHEEEKENKTTQEADGAAGAGGDDEPPRDGQQQQRRKQKSKLKSKSGSTAHRQSTICSIRICPDTKEMMVCVNDGSVWRCCGAESLHDLQYSWRDVSPRMAADAPPLFEPIGAFNVSWTQGLSMVAHPSGPVSLCSLETGAILHRWQPHVRRTLNMWMFERPDRGEVLLVTSSSDNTCAVWRLRQGNAPEPVVVVHTQKGEDATAACLIDDVLLVGDKIGSVHVVDLRLLPEDAKAVEPHQTLRRVHGREIVSSIAAWPAGDAVISLGHDGDLVLYSWQGRTLRLRDRLTAHPISIPETVWTAGKTLLVGGWHGSHYMIWDLISRYQFLKVDGGSWRRCHASSLSGSPAFPLPFFACSLPRKGELSLSVHRMAGAQLAVPDRYCFHPSGHGKPVLCSVWLNPAAGRPDLSTLVTAGQDGRVLVWRTQHAPPPPPQQQQQQQGVDAWRLQQPLTGHITIMRALAVSNQDGSTGMLAAGGGKLTINLWRYEPADADGSLQFHFVAQHCLWKKATQDHRIFCLQAIPCPFGKPSDGAYWVMAGDSRSMLTVTRVNAASGECGIVAELPVDGYPLLCCRSLVLSSNAATLVLTAVGSTNGDVHLVQCGLQVGNNDEAACNADITCRILHSFAAHQMGANCVDMRLASCIPGDCAGVAQWTVSIVSGGDDQAIAVTQARVSVDCRSWTVSCAHLFTEIVTDSAGSALKSIAFTQRGSHCVSVGYDQRLSVWRLHFPEVAARVYEGKEEAVSKPPAEAEARYRRTSRRDSTCLRYAAAAVVNVGDVSGLSLAASAANGSDTFIRAAVTGQGMQLVRIHFDSGVYSAKGAADSAW